MHPVFLGKLRTQPKEDLLQQKIPNNRKCYRYRYTAPCLRPQTDLGMEIKPERNKEGKRCNEINCFKTKNTIPLFFFCSDKLHYIVLTHRLTTTLKTKKKDSLFHPKSKHSHCNTIQNTPPTSTIISQAQQDKNN